MVLLARLTQYHVFNSKFRRRSPLGMNLIITPPALRIIWEALLDPNPFKTFHIMTPLAKVLKCLMLAACRSKSGIPKRYPCQWGSAGIPNSTLACHRDTASSIKEWKNRVVVEVNQIYHFLRSSLWRKFDSFQELLISLYSVADSPDNNY